MAIEFTPAGFDAFQNNISSVQTVLIGTAVSTGTTSQVLQVGSATTALGAYVSGSVGIGTTNPTQSLHIQGSARITGGLYDSNNNVGTGGSVLSSTGSGISWIASSSGSGSISISTNTTNQSQYLTYVTGTGNTTGLGITTTGLVFNPSTGNLGIGTTNPTTTVSVAGSFTAYDTRIQSLTEKSTLINGNTVNLVYNTGGGNIAICTNPTGPITLNVTGIPTDSTFNNSVLTFTVVAIQTSIGYACTTVNLNGTARTIRYPGSVVSTASTTSYDIFNFTGINTIGSASTTTNYQILGIVNGNFK